MRLPEDAGHIPREKFPKRKSSMASPSHIARTITVNRESKLIRSVALQAGLLARDLIARKIPGRNFRFAAFPSRKKTEQWHGEEKMSLTAARPRRNLTVFP
jgi:hypothetical protein